MKQRIQALALGAAQLLQAAAVADGKWRQMRQVDQRGKHIQQLCDAVQLSSLSQGELWTAYDEGHTQGYLEVAVLGPLGVLAQRPAVIAEHNNDCALQVEARQQLAKQIVHIGHRGVVGLADLRRLLPGNGSVGKRYVPMLKVISRANIRVGIPGHLWHVRRLQRILRVVVEMREGKSLQKLHGKTKVDVRLVDAQSQKVGLATALAGLDETQRLRYGFNVRQRFVRLRLQLHRANEIVLAQHTAAMLGADGRVHELLGARMKRWRRPAQGIIISVVGRQTRMEDLATAIGVVAMLLEVLRQGRKVAHKAAPVAVEVIQVQGIWTSASQQGISARRAQRLLKGQTTCEAVPVGRC